MSNRWGGFSPGGGPGFAASFFAAPKQHINGLHSPSSSSASHAHSATWSDRFANLALTAVLAEVHRKPRTPRILLGETPIRHVRDGMDAQPASRDTLARLDFREHSRNRRVVVSRQVPREVLDVTISNQPELILDVDFPGGDGGHERTAAARDDPRDPLEQKMATDRSNFTQ